MRLLKIFVLSCLAAAVASAQTASTAQPKEGKSVRFSKDMLSESIDPCTDFYAFACSKWKAQNPIPADRATWGRFNELAERGEYILRDILEKASVPNASRSPIEQKIGDYYASCMDESAIEKQGLKPLEAGLKAVSDIKSRNDLVRSAVWMHRQGINAFFSFGTGSDFKDASHVIAGVDQGGMSLPDRDYYLRTGQKDQELRDKFVAHVQKMFELTGDPSEKAAAEAKVVLNIETQLAKGALDVVSRRDPEKIYHKMTRGEVAALSPNFAWDRYFEGIGGASIPNVDVSDPEFFKNFNSMLGTVPLDTWKTYLRWHVIHDHATLLPKKFVEENFDYFDRTLVGIREQPPRWKRCVRDTTADLGQAVGQKYVELTFGPEGKERTLKMVNAIESALERDIKDLPWMTEETKKQALNKLAAITNRIGYPDKWRDYSKFEVKRGEALGNSDRANVFSFERNLAKVGKLVDKGDWPYPPSTVNASYNPLQNNITFPAGILQPPFFDKEADDAINFGAIGAVIGHELTHGFDDQGRQFDAHGNLNDWWKKEDADEFKKRAQCVSDQYSGYTAIDDVKVNGKLTLGENVADNGGMRVAYMALLTVLAGKEPAPVDGLTAQQRFFLGWANFWCESRRDEALRVMAQTNEHSPGPYRVNGVVSNMPEFREAYHCKADAPMVRQNACRVW